MLRSRWFYLVLTVLAVLPFLSGCGGSRVSASPESADKARNTSAPVPVTTAPVTPRPIQRKVSVVGTFFGFEEVAIAPKVEGRVAKIHHDIGDVVRPGEPLMEIEPTDYQLAVEEARRALELELSKLGLQELPPAGFDVSNIPTVVRAQLTAINAAHKAERALSLAASRAISEEEIEQVQTDAKVAEATRRWVILETQATLAAARQKQAALAMAQQRLRDTRLLVPDLSRERLSDVRSLAPAASEAAIRQIEFVVTQRMTSEGEMVRDSGTGPVFRLVMDRPLKLVARAAERFIGEVKPGQTVLLHVEAYPSETFRAGVWRVNPTVDQASRTFQVEVLVPNEDRRLKAGGFAKAEILTHIDPHAPTVPEDAIVSFAGNTKLFVVHEGRAHSMLVRLGDRVQVPEQGGEVNWVEVLGDLPAGSQVVTTGHSKLAENTPVRIKTTSE